jgi:hypothetical protein
MGEKNQTDLKQSLDKFKEEFEEFVYKQKYKKSSFTLNSMEMKDELKKYSFKLFENLTFSVKYNSFYLINISN